MFSHAMLGVNDLEVSRKFYDALLGTLGIKPGLASKNRYFYRSPGGSFAITIPINGEPSWGQVLPCASLAASNRAYPVVFQGRNHWWRDSAPDATYSGRTELLGANRLSTRRTSTRKR